MKTRRPLLATVLFLTASIAACDGGNVLEDAKAKSKAACECEDAECVREYVKWFNEQSLKDGGKALEGLSEGDRAAFEELSLKAGECQMEIKMKAAE